MSVLVVLSRLNRCCAEGVRVLPYFQFNFNCLIDCSKLFATELIRVYITFFLNA